MAFTHPQSLATEEATRLRKAVGAKLKALREAVGKTQREVANDCGFEYYTMVSQIESGKTRVPPMQMVPYAKSLGIPTKEFAKLMMQHYDPIMFEILYTNKHQEKNSA